MLESLMSTWVPLGSIHSHGKSKSYTQNLRMSTGLLGWKFQCPPGSLAKRGKLNRAAGSQFLVASPCICYSFFSRSSLLPWRAIGFSVILNKNLQMTESLIRKITETCQDFQKWRHTSESFFILHCLYSLDLLQCWCLRGLFTHLQDPQY